MKLISSVDQDVSRVSKANIYYIKKIVLLPTKIEQYTLMHFIIDTCEIIMNNHTCKIIDFICGGKINEPLYFI